MHIRMPAGFLLLLPALLARRTRHPVLLNLLPLLCFFAPGLLGMALMMVSTLHLSSADPKANWLEQEGSGAAQPCFFLGLTLLP